MPDHRIPLAPSHAALLIGLAGFAAAPAHAQSPTSGAVVLNPLQVTAPARPDTEPGGQTVDADAVARTNPSDLKELFSEESALTVGGAIPVAQKLYVNGIEDTKLAVSIDGARQTNATFHHVGTIVLDPGLIKSVAVEPGVAPADAGPAALAGSVAFATKDPGDLIAPGKDFGGFATLSYDSNTEGFSEGLAVAGRAAFAEIMAYANHTGGHSFKDGNGDTVRGTAPDLTNYLAKAVFSAPDGAKLKLTANRVEDEGDRPNRPNFAGIVSTTALRHVDYTRTTASVTYDTDTPTGLFNPKLSLAHNALSLDIQPGWWSDIDTTTASAANVFAFDLGTLTTGLDLQRDVASGGAQGAKSTEKATNVGAFAQARLAPLEGWRVSFGGRGDRQRFEGIEGSTFDNFGLSGNLNTEVDVTPWMTPYAGYGHVFGGIPLGESAIYNVSGVWRYANLAPESARNTRFGSRFAFGDFSFDVGGHFTKIDDSHEIGSVNRASTVDLTSRGYDISGKYVYDQGFVRLAYSDNKVRVDGRVPSSTTTYQGLSLGSMVTLQAERRFADWGVTVGTSQVYAPSNGELTTTSGATPLNQYYVANLYAAWTPEDFQALTLRLDAKNIFDRHYVDRANAGVDSAAAIPYHEPGQSVLVTARLTF